MPARIKYLLEKYPDTRDSYNLLIFRYWLEFDGLDTVLGYLPSLHDAVLHWARDCATSPKTIQNRCMECQREHPELDSIPAIRQERNRQATQGVVK